MSGPYEFFSEDHRACDALWGELEGAVDSGDEVAAKGLWERFDAAMRRHYDMEEKELFPAIEQALGMTGFGPVMVMLQEHAQMRSLLGRMGAAAGNGDFGLVVDEGDTLLMLVGQHNTKEEGILYPIADQHLGEAWGALKARLDRY